MSDISTRDGETNPYIQQRSGFRIASTQSADAASPLRLEQVAHDLPGFTSEDAMDIEARTLRKIGSTFVSSVSSVVET